MARSSSRGRTRSCSTRAVATGSCTGTGPNRPRPRLVAGSIVVSGLALTPVKGMRLRSVDQIELRGDGAGGNRRFLATDERARMITGKAMGELCSVLADYRPAEDRLRLTFPDGSVVEGPVKTQGSLPVKFFGHTLAGEPLLRDWSDA